VSVNRSWDEYCKQLQVNHTQQVAALSAELSEVRQRLADRQKADDERQRDFDELLLSAKKQRQDEEVHQILIYSAVFCYFFQFLMIFRHFFNLMYCLILDEKKGCGFLHVFRQN